MTTTTALAVTDEQLDLVRRTIAQGATDAELKLYLYDCARMGVHPLDKLLHFTKRGGKYVPVTSIDLMRMRAADTGEMAGSDDAVFEFAQSNTPLSATVTVYRITQGQRFAYAATARWAEYYPGDQSGQMWKKMPHTMLGKCAEALALRKGFPKQLAGLYAREEMDQADAPEAKPTPEKPQPKAPPQFDQWEHDLAAAAAEGLHKLKEAWEGTTKENRQHLNATRPDAFTRLKAIAAKVEPVSA